MRFRLPAPLLGTVHGAAIGVALLCATVALIGPWVPGNAIAATPANAHSPLGLDLDGVTYYSPEQPFLNIFKTAGAWVTGSGSTYDTGEEAYLQLDANGYPTTLSASSADPHAPQLFTHVGVILLNNLPNSNFGSGPPYRAGNYVVLYDGQGTLVYTLDAHLVSSSPGRDVINVATPTYGGGIGITIGATDPQHIGNYIRNIRVVKAEEERLLDAGYIFRPGFLSLLQNFRALRFMDWLDTNNSTLSSWSSRPTLDSASWGTGGVPIEVAADLCNAVGADCWLNVPHMADNNYMTQMATLVHQTLGSTQKVYIEFSNEVWNYVFSQASYAQTQGQAMWPGANVTPFDFNRNWFGMRTAQMCDIWKSTWGADGSRVVCVLGAQAANTYTATESLQCPLWTGAGNGPCAGHGIGAVAIAPYFGGAVPASWTSQPDGGLSKLFESMTQQNDPSIPAGGWLAQISQWEAAYKAALAPFNLPFIAYESGQTFQGFPNYPNGSPMVQLFIAANHDPRMAAAYTTALNSWKANGGELYLQFVDISPYNQYGEWGAMQSFLDTVYPLSSAPPKWQALQNFIASNPCWWPGCTGTVSGATATPNSPTNLQSLQN
jgi:hypothetical protein